MTSKIVFQTDSEIVKKAYTEQENYKIVINENAEKSYCVLYFSSNDIYYPNNEKAFEESILDKNRFEWFGNRIKIAYKNVFIRDIQKQWYLEGINSQINSIPKLIEFLKKETDGFKIICVGASAGGFASIIIGQELGAERIYTFNGQFEILSLLYKSKESVDPILFRNKENVDLLKYYDNTNFIKKPSSIFYFYSMNSQWDKEQNEYAKSFEINRIGFKTTNHGIPFLKSNLKELLNLPHSDLIRMSGEKYSPLTFSLKLVGIFGTIGGLSSIVKFGLNKIYINTLQKILR